MVEPHVVTVTTHVEDEGTADEWRCVDRVTFRCSADAGADCRTYPQCGCEYWVYDDAEPSVDQCGHPRVAGQQCWIESWFENDAAAYVGDDRDDGREDGVPAVERSGPITVQMTQEWPEWEWADVAAHSGADGAVARLN